MPSDAIFPKLDPDLHLIHDSFGSPESLSQTTSILFHTLLHSYFQFVTMGCQCFPKIALSHVGSKPHIIHTGSSLGPPHSPHQATYQSPSPLLRGSQSGQTDNSMTDRMTDRQTDGRTKHKKTCISTGV